ELRDAEARGQRDPARSGHLERRLAQRAAHPVGNERRGLHVRLWQENSELLASEPPSNVDLPHVGPQEVAERLERPVAREVAVLVVDALEVVEIREHERERGFEQTRPFELVLQRLQEAATVDEASELVGGCL